MAARVPSRRAYILVVVVMLTIVVGMMAAVGLNRQGAQSLEVTRQTRAYQQHHAARGIQEAIGVWLRTVSARNLADALGERGHALDITLDGGVTLEVYLHDGQGSALADLSGVVQAEVDIAGATLANLQNLVGDERFSLYTREGGPAAVSINAAPEPVIRAVLLSTLTEAMTDEMTDAIMDMRSAGTRLTRNDLTEALTAVGATGVERTAVTRMITEQPEVWWVTVIGRHTIRGVTARYGGLVVLRSASRGGTSAGTSSFVSWQDLGVGPRRVSPPPGIPEID
ncbi:MAG: hypothetical protein RIB60_06570 [Phycisphaerales bacterium]